MHSLMGILSLSVKNVDMKYVYFKLHNLLVCTMKRSITFHRCYCLFPKLNLMLLLIKTFKRRRNDKHRSVIRRFSTLL